MALQFSTSVRNAMLDSIESTIGTSCKVSIHTGSLPATCASSATGTKLVEWSLGADWASDASGGAKSFSSTPVATTAVGTGTAGYFRIYNAGGTVCHFQGTVTATGGGGDMTLDNTSINSGQIAQIASFTITAPGA